MIDTFPSLLDRLHREGYTGDLVLCFAEGVPKVARFVKSDDVRLVRDKPPTMIEAVDGLNTVLRSIESMQRQNPREPFLVPLAIVHVKA